MDYKKIYNNLMESRYLLKQKRILDKKNGFYFEGHHIVPKSMGGEGYSNRPNSSSNIVLLTAREHFLAHWLLWLIYRNRKMSLAFHKMTSINKKQNRYYSSYGYEEARISFSKTNIGNKYGVGVKKVLSEQTKEKISKFRKGKYTGKENSFFGKKHSVESKALISKKAKERFSKEYVPSLGKRVVFKNNEFLGEFNNNKEVAKFISCSESNVRHVLSKDQKTAKGYNIYYKSEKINN